VIAKYAVTLCFDDVCYLKKENKLKQESHAMVYDGDEQSWCKQSLATKIITLWKHEYEIRMHFNVYLQQCVQEWRTPSVQYKRRCAGTDGVSL